MIKLVHVYYALGAVLSAVAWQSLRAAAPGPRWRRFTTAAFWQLLALLFLVGDLLPKAVAGGVVLALAALAGSG
ncbi:MAG TPA: DUF979 family protein, partial [Kofleriaceae bacterium]|nr:DUF979 family protein [Kofleriaceae bacterium]